MGRFQYSDKTLEISKYRKKVSWIGGLCKIRPDQWTEHRKPPKGDFQRYGNLYIVIFSDDWTDFCTWVKYARVESNLGLTIADVLTHRIAEDDLVLITTYF